jgi:hypothetical protein
MTATRYRVAAAAAAVALSAGAVDLVQKPTALATEELFGIREQLVEKVKIAARAPVGKLVNGATHAATAPVRDYASLKTDVVVLGVSTGGPQALRRLLPALSADLNLLFGQTLALARVEAASVLRSTVLYVAVAVAGVALAVGGFLVLLSALVLIAVALGLPPWAAATLVGLLLVIAGALTAYFCVAGLKQLGFTLPHTRRSLKDTLAWLKAQTTP